MNGYDFQKTITNRCKSDKQENFLNLERTMSFQKKVLIGYVLFNAVMITNVFLNVQKPDLATTTDQDMVIYGVVKPVGAALSLISSGIVVILLYVVRWMMKLVSVLHRKWHERVS